MTQYGGKQLVIGGSGLAAAARAQAVDPESKEGVVFMRNLLEQGKFAIGGEGEAEEIPYPKEIEREVVSVSDSIPIFGAEKYKLSIVRFDVWTDCWRPCAAWRYEFVDRD